MDAAERGKSGWNDGLQIFDLIRSRSEHEHCHLAIRKVLLVIAMSQLYPENFRGTFGDKISGENQSGHMRVESSLNTRELFGSFSVMNWMFGIGFGYAYNGITLA